MQYRGAYLNHLVNKNLHLLLLFSGSVMDVFQIDPGTHQCAFEGFVPVGLLCVLRVHTNLPII